MVEDPEPRLVAAAHVLGPLLLFLGSCAFLADLPGWEGVLGFYGAIVVTPALLAVPRRFADWFPRYAALCQVVGLLGGSGLALGLAMRTIYVALLRAGLVQGGFDETMPSLFITASNPEVVLVWVIGPAFPAALILSGGGLWQARVEPTTTGPLLVASGLLFVVAQVALVAQSITYPASFLCLLAALAPLGWPALQR